MSERLDTPTRTEAVAHGFPGLNQVDGADLLGRVAIASQRFAERFVTHVAVISAVLGFGLGLVVMLCQMDEVVEARGGLEPQEIHFVKAPMALRVTETHIPDDLRVRKGQLLLVLDRRDLDVEREVLQSEVDKLHAELAIKRKTVALERVRRSGKLRSIDAQRGSLRYALGARHRAVRRMRETLRELEQLRQRGLVPEDTVNTRRNEKETVLTAIKATATQLRQANTSREVEAARLGLREAEEQELALLARLIRAKERCVADLDARIMETRIFAPSDGYISGVELDRLEGNLLKRGETLFAVYAPGAWEVRALVPESQVRKVSAGQHAKVTVDGYPAVHYSPLEGTVRVLTNLSASPGDQAPRGVPVLVRLARPPATYRGLRPGMTAQVRITIDTGSIAGFLWRNLVESGG